MLKCGTRKGVEMKRVVRLMEEIALVLMIAMFLASAGCRDSHLKAYDPQFDNSVEVQGPAN